MSRTIGILTIATNRYVNYWEKMVLSAHKTLFPNFEVNFHVFTDQPETVTEFVKINSIKGVLVHQIPSLDWPEATLYRYKIYLEHASQLKEDILMHLDADMVVNDSAEFLLKDFEWTMGILLVKHPGFYRPSEFAKLLKLYSLRPILFVKDCFLRARIGGIGAWETNPSSQAYVLRKNRSVYVCGGAWLGYRSSFFSMVEKLSAQVDEDLQSGYIAKWHDESHLNLWHSQNYCLVIDPALCHDKSYSYLKAIKPVITAVNKNVG